MKEFFNTENVNFAIVGDSLVCVKRSGLNEVHINLPKPPEDENIASLKVDLERHTVYGNIYRFEGGEWIEI